MTKRFDNLFKEKYLIRFFGLNTLLWTLFNQLSKKTSKTAKTTVVLWWVDIDQSPSEFKTFGTRIRYENLGRKSGTRIWDKPLEENLIIKWIDLKLKVLKITRQKQYSNKRIYLLVIHKPCIAKVQHFSEGMYNQHN